jgi:alpha-glucosidase
LAIKLAIQPFFFLSLNFLFILLIFKFFSNNFNKIIQSLDDLKQTVSRIQKAQIPLDVVFADIDYMDRYKDFTVDPLVNKYLMNTFKEYSSQKWSGLGDYVRELHQQGLKFVPIVDPAIEVN